MQKKLKRRGFSLALEIDKPILDLIGADSHTVFEISTDGKSIVATPLDRSPDLDTAIETVYKNHFKVLERLKK